MWWAVWSWAPQSQLWGSFDEGWNWALYSPVKSCMVSIRILVENISMLCVASIWMKDGLLPSGEEVNTR